MNRRDDLGRQIALLKARRLSRKSKENFAEVSVALTSKELHAVRESAFFQAAQQAWFATALEQTKSIFTLASAGVGLTATLVFQTDQKPDCSYAPVWLMFAAFFFVVSASLCIGVFGANKAIVGNLVNADDADTGSKVAAPSQGLARRLDKGAKIAFHVGMIFLLFALVAKIWL